MSKVKALEDVVGELIRVGRTLEQLRLLQPEGWKRAYVDGRREAIHILIQLSQCTEDMFANGIATASKQDFRQQFNAFRSALALHQANWPVVSMDMADPNYRASMDAVDIARDMFLGCVQDIVRQSSQAA